MSRRERINAYRRSQYAKRSPEQRAADAERVRANRAQLRERRIAEYGPPPECECGCGQPVGFNRYGKPNRFAPRHVVMPDGARDIQFGGERVPTAKAAAALEKLRREHGWSIQEMADRGGVNRTTLWSIMRDPNYAARYGVDADMLRRMLIKLSGRLVSVSAEERRMTERRYTVTDADRYA